MLVGWVGRLIPVKGCDVFLRALAQLEADGWCARVIGDGPERARLEALARELAIDGKVTFVGAIPGAARLLAGLDLFVLSSRSEGTPMALLEAMGAGVAVAATRVGGVPDVLRAPDEGWLVSPDASDELARVIDEAVRDCAQRDVRSRRAEERVQTTYDLATWVRRHEEIYRAAISVRRGDE